MYGKVRFLISVEARELFRAFLLPNVISCSTLTPSPPSVRACVDVHGEVLCLASVEARELLRGILLQNVLTYFLFEFSRVFFRVTSIQDTYSAGLR